MHHVYGQEAVLKAEVNTKCLDADVLHTDGERSIVSVSLQINASECLQVISGFIPVFIGRLLNDVP